MHRLFRGKKKDDAEKARVDRCPYATRPRVGLYGTHSDAALACTRVEVSASMEPTTAKTTIALTYVPDYGKADLWFPLSEFGKVKEFRCSVNGIDVEGQMHRRGVDDSNLFPAGHVDYDAKRAAMRRAKSEAHAASELGAAGIGADDADGNEARRAMPTATNSLGGAAAPAMDGGNGSTATPLYYFIARDVHTQLTTPKSGDGLLKVGNVNAVVFEVVAGNVKDKDDKPTYIFPYTSVPKPPSAFAFKVRAKQTLRAITTPNRGTPIYPFIRGKTADVVVEAGGKTPMRTEDYLFIIHVELGAPIVPQCADPVSLLILVSAIGAFVFFSLTHTLEEDY